MSYTMHSPSQGYTNSSADVYGSRAYAGHLMTQNYTTYVSREDPYNGNTSAQYANGPSQSPYPINSSISQATYPLPPISHFPNQQDVYASCVAPSRNQLSYPSTPTPVGSNHGSVPRHPVSKGYWNCESVQQTSHHYPSTNSTHKTSPQAWSHSPNVMSSPSSTPSPIPGSSTPHHFASSPHHSQSINENHKSYNGNGIMTPNSSLSSNNSSAAGNLNCNNPLQSLQKMVQIEADNNDIRVQYESSPVQSSVPMGAVSQHQNSQSNAQLGALESDPNYPTYYNLDQNRLCATPQSAYSNIPAQSLNAAPFSPTLKSTQEIRSQPLQNNCPKSENSVENGDLNRTSAMRFSNKLSKENSFLASRSCSTDTCSNGSPSAQSTKVASIPDSALQAEQTHDSVNSFRGSETTANSRDSVKSTDSDGMSSYAANQCPTPNNNNNSTAWKLNASVNQSNEYRQGFPNSVPGKGWWPENAISPSASRSFTPHIAECAQQYSGGSSAAATAAGVNFNSVQGSRQMSAATNSSTPSLPPSQSWSQQSSTPPSVSTTPQMLPTAATFPDGSMVKKKRGRPFGSKNRRNLEAGPSTCAESNSGKRKRKTVLVDIGVNTNLSFDVQSSLNVDDSCAFDTTVKHSLPLVMKRKKVVGPVVRIDKSASGLNCQTKYSIVNTTKSATEEEKDTKIKTSPTKTTPDSVSHSRKNGMTKRCNQTSNSYLNLNLSEKNWLCVLCHKGPHYKGLGDLYGPYGIVIDKCKLSTALDQILEVHEDSSETEHTPERRSLRKRADSAPATEDNKSKPVNAPTTNSTTLNQDESKINIDVWIHEDCIVWSNNVYLEGTKIRNLEPAIVESFNNICTKCKLPGATLGCIYKNCTVSPLHYLCAKDKDCDLDEEKFILSCSKHKKRRISPKEAEVVEVSEATTTATNDTLLLNESS